MALTGLRSPEISLNQMNILLIITYLRVYLLNIPKSQRKKSSENLKIKGRYLRSFYTSLLPVKLADEPSNFLTATDSTVLESLSLNLVSKRLRKTLSLSHLLLQYTSGMSSGDGKFNLCWTSCGSFVLTCDNRDFTQRRRKGLTTAFPTESNWDDDLVLSTVKLRYATMVFLDVAPS